LLLVLAWRSPADWRVRLALAAGAGLIVAGFHALAWPHCLSRLEGVSPEVERLWLNNVREAKPIYGHGWRTATMIMAIPAVGAAGWAVLVWRARGDRDLLRRTSAAAAIAIVSFALLSWQTRAGPAAQMLGVTGSVALAWLLLPLAWRSTNSAVVVLGTSIVLLLGIGAAVPFVMTFVPDEASSKQGKVINKANNLCPSMWAMKPVAKLPKGTIFTFVDLAPRVITITHHNSVAGPYHRNGPAIADTMKAFQGNADQARVLIAKHQADYLMICPNMSQATVFMSRAPKGFYAQLARGQVPGWLQPIALPKDSPLRIWRVMK
jgi:hypothetical protein